MKKPNTVHLIAIGLLTAVSLSTHVTAADKAAATKAEMSAQDVDKISDGIRQTGEQMRADLKKARARFEAQEVERKQSAERARLQAIKDNEQRQAEKAAQERERQQAAQAQAERARQEAEQIKQAKLQAERKKQMVLAAQAAKESQAAELKARKAQASEALKKMRASSEPKAF